MFPKNLFLILNRSMSVVILLAFVTTSIRVPAYAQMVGDRMPNLPAPGGMVRLSPEFTPALLKGIVIHPENAFKFDFIVYKGDKLMAADQKKTEYTKLIKYFLASLAVPDENQWVNLSPYEKDRIVKDDFGKTEMGRDLLAQDYLLKQITASLIYPQDKLGAKFWDRTYARAYKQFGTTNIPFNTFNKVWIMPDEADIYEKGNVAYLYKSHLKVMLQEDYLSLKQHSGIQGTADLNNTHALGSQVVREILLPELEKEVNQGKSFAPLRQVFSGMILAAWYKRALRESLLARIYANKAKVKGVDQDPRNNQLIYKQYLTAFKKGVFNFIKEDVDKYSNQIIPRKYFSGGVTGIALKGQPDAYGNREAVGLHVNPQGAPEDAQAAMMTDGDNAGIELAASTVDPAKTGATVANNEMTSDQLAQKIVDLGLKPGDKVRVKYAFVDFVGGLPGERVRREHEGTVITVNSQSRELLVSIFGSKYVLHFGKVSYKDEDHLVDVDSVANKAMVNLRLILQPLGDEIQAQLRIVNRKYNKGDFAGHQQANAELTRMTNEYFRQIPIDFREAEKVDGQRAWEYAYKRMEQLERIIKREAGRDILSPSLAYNIANNELGIWKNLLIGKMPIVSKKDIKEIVDSGNIDWYIRTLQDLTKELSSSDDHILIWKQGSTLPRYFLNLFDDSFGSRDGIINMIVKYLTFRGKRDQLERFLWSTEDVDFLNGFPSSPDKYSGVRFKFSSRFFNSKKNMKELIAELKPQLEELTNELIAANQKVREDNRAIDLTNAAMKGNPEKNRVNAMKIIGDGRMSFYVRGSLFSSQDRYKGREYTMEELLPLAETEMIEKLKGIIKANGMLVDRVLPYIKVSLVRPRSYEDLTVDGYYMDRIEDYIFTATLELQQSVVNQAMTAEAPASTNDQTVDEENAKRLIAELGAEIEFSVKRVIPGTPNFGSHELLVLAETRMKEELNKAILQRGMDPVRIVPFIDISIINPNGSPGKKEPNGMVNYGFAARLEFRQPSNPTTIVNGVFTGEAVANWLERLLIISPNSQYQVYPYQYIQETYYQTGRTILERLRNNSLNVKFEKNGNGDIGIIFLDGRNEAKRIHGPLLIIQHSAISLLERIFKGEHVLLKEVAMPNSGSVEAFQNTASLIRLFKGDLLEFLNLYSVLGGNNLSTQQEVLIRLGQIPEVARLMAQEEILTTETRTQFEKDNPGTNSDSIRMILSAATHRGWLGTIPNIVQYTQILHDLIAEAIAKGYVTFKGQTLTLEEFENPKASFKLTKDNFNFGTDSDLENRLLRSSKLISGAEVKTWVDMKINTLAAPLEELQAIKVTTNPEKWKAERPGFLYGKQANAVAVVLRVLIDRPELIEGFKTADQEGKLKNLLEILADENARWRIGNPWGGLSDSLLTKPFASKEKGGIGVEEIVKDAVLLREILMALRDNKVNLPDGIIDNVRAAFDNGLRAALDEIVKIETLDRLLKESEVNQAMESANVDLKKGPAEDNGMKTSEVLAMLFAAGVPLTLGVARFMYDKYNPQAYAPYRISQAQHVGRHDVITVTDHIGHKYIITTKDKSMSPNQVIDQTPDKIPGGIDLNAAMLTMNIKRDGKGVPLPVSQQNLENIHIDGLVPVILAIRPVMPSTLLSLFQLSMAR